MVLDLSNEHSKIDDLMDLLNDEEIFSSQTISIFSKLLTINEKITFNCKSKKLEAMYDHWHVLYTDDDPYLFEAALPKRQDSLIRKLNYYLTFECDDSVLDKEHNLMLDKVMKQIKAKLISQIPQYNLKILNLDNYSMVDLKALIEHHQVSADDVQALFSK